MSQDNYIKRLDEFASATIEEANRIGKSFFKEYHVMALSYVKIYHDNHILGMHTNANLAKLHIELNCSPMPSISPHLWSRESFYYLGSKDDNPEFALLLNTANQRFNCDQPLFIITQLEDHIEIAVLNTYVNNKFATNLYLNNLLDIRAFVKYFREATHCIYLEGQSYKYRLPESVHPKIESKPDDTFSELRFNTFYKNIITMSKSYATKITQREGECLYFLSKGMRYKEIGLKLGISARTVESHIINIRDKFDFRTREQLLKKVLQYTD